MKNIISTIKAVLFQQKKTEERAEWIIHWYAHILVQHEGLTYIKCDHTGIVKDWDNDRIVPRLGDTLSYITDNDQIEENKRRFNNLPMVLNGVVIEVVHDASSKGGVITVFAHHLILGQGDVNVHRVVGDETFAEVEEARQQILSGDTLPLMGFINVQ